MDERCSMSRQRILKAGKIEIGGGSTIDCTVRNLSKIGAALDVSSPVGIPDEFELIIPNDARRFTCRVVWRKAGRIGIRFDSGQ
ncbi:MAG: PilZ domain-containing protein [Nitrobacter sp.]